MNFYIVGVIPRGCTFLSFNGHEKISNREYQTTAFAFHLTAMKKSQIANTKQRPSHFSLTAMKKFQIANTKQRPSHFYLKTLMTHNVSK
ncbi:MAG: hypothetical protein DRR19_33060 [Candidatus Parabeggiatoa sp. nov. 1]|nr:MAG: hypothetical protein DRR19_33060 [Gammaproteobacteria bacterium]